MRRTQTVLMGVLHPTSNIFKRRDIVLQMATQTVRGFSRSNREEGTLIVSVLITTKMN